MKRLLFTIFFALLFASCASTGLSKVFVTNTKRVSLLPADAILESVEEFQFFSATFGEKSFSTPLFLQADSSGIQIVILNDFGLELGGLSYDGERAEMDSPVLPSDVKPEYILLDLQNAYADSQKLKTHYETYKLIFEETQNEDETVRKIKNGKDVIEEITISKNKTKIVNFLRGYEYSLTEPQGE